MNKYELLYIVSNQYTDAEIEKIAEQVSGEVTTAGGTIVSSQVIGKIRLAYPIKKQRHGTYVLVYFDAESEAVQGLNRKLSLMNELLRHTIGSRVPGAEKKTFELSSYVAPLSEEASEIKRVGANRNYRSADRPQRAAPEPKKPVLPPLTPSSSSAQEQKMSIEELDKKLDQLLEMDPTENI